MAHTPQNGPQPSIPLHMDGFVAGNTVHVEGDAGNIHFSGQFDIHQQRNTLSDAYIYGAGSPEVLHPESHLLSLARVFSSITQKTHEVNDPIMTTKSPPSTPPGNPNPQPIEFPDLDRMDVDHTPENRQIPAHECYKSSDVTTMTTRLRSGAISPVTYFPRAARAHVCESCDNARGSSSKSKWRKRGRSNEMEGGDLVERVLRRHSFPTRPCNSYTFFVMSKWRVAHSSSFQETSRRLSDMWRRIPDKEKNVRIC
ncbi:uncharacterized protein LOC131249845 isoform X2 [Magnolia sinica]|uniref:uncharacterized protein LOC131249845 isoform X2 n=1 Tax=Magnolia sinica TaxID=86752 RepID=UPI00265A03A6|nr:uncharacterized protein LOC131249845 isoform X2 [Magnolia sinica]